MYTVQSDHPVPVVNVIVLNDRDEILLTERSIPPYEGSWVLPSGRIDVQDDSAEHAAVREVKEETGLDVTLTHLVGVASNGQKTPATMDPRFFVVKAVYVARVRGGTLTKNAEARGFQWKSADDILANANAFGFNHRETVALYAENQSNLISIERSRYTDWYGKIFPYEQQKYPRFACLAVILNQQKEILLAHRARNPFRGAWDLPGGHLYVDETPEACLQREVKEELGVSCAVGALLQVYSDKGQNPKNADIAAVYFAAVEEGRFERNVEMDDFGYFPFHRLPEQVAYQNRRVIADVTKHL